MNAHFDISIINKKTEKSNSLIKYFGILRFTFSEKSCIMFLLSFQRRISMQINIRKACAGDLDAIAEIYDHIHTAEEQGQAAIGWIRGVYPERATAEAALARGDIFIEEADGKAVGTAIINQIQVDTYADAP